MDSENGILPVDIKCPSCFEELELDEQERLNKKFTCPNCNIIFDLSNVVEIGTIATSQLPQKLTPEWAVYMENKIASMESHLQEYEMLLPKSNIISASFWNRAWAVFGHQLAISAILYGAVILIILILTLGRIH
ncbi:MAG: hypothetical protein V1720_13375 [bacterium]